MAEVGEVLEIREVARSATEMMVWRREVVDDIGNDLWSPYRIDLDTFEESSPPWMPLPGSQFAFLQSPVFETLYCGTRGPGKTLTLLMDFCRGVGQGYGSAWRGILFRKEYKDLDDVVRKIEEWAPKMFPGFRFLKSKAEYMALWPDGEALLLRAAREEDDYDDYHGHEYPWIGFEELTQWPDKGFYMKIQSCCRPTRPGIPCRIRSTTNPYGQGHNWVKKRFEIVDWPTGKIVRIAGEMPRVAIHGDLSENFLLLHTQPMYRTIVKNAASNQAEAEAWLSGTWAITAGGMIDDIWSENYHVLPNFPAEAIPHGWTICRAYDHGQSRPHAVGWFLESNGEPMNWEGRLIGNVRGDRIMFSEWYGTTGEENQGVRMSARKIAQGILDREDDLGLTGRITAGPADTEIWSKDSRGTGRAPFDDMEDEGVLWEPADKRPGSRHRGWQMMRTFLEDAVPEPDGTRDKPGFFVCRRCKWWLQLVPPMPRSDDDLDDVPKTYEDHLADMTRYYLNWEVPGMFRRGF